MNVCISIAPSSTRDAIAKLKDATAQADLVEIRIDGAATLDLERILRRPRPNVIVTNRRHSDGGQFDGSGEEQLEILLAAAQYGAEYVDIESSWGKSIVRELMMNKGRCKAILSHHDFTRTPKNLTSLFDRMCELNPDIVKIATMAKDITDNIVLFDLLKHARKKKQATSAFCMGERGQISRILGGTFGCHTTYASSSGDSCTAPGQITAAELNEVFHVRTLNSRSRIFGLIGNPVIHSRGIHYHNAIFRKKKINAIYVNFLVEDIGTFFSAFRPFLSGASVTMPFKEKVMPLLDRIDENALRAHAVNTIIMRRGKSFGANTDLPAIVSIMKKRTALRGKRVLILGTGATAKTMLIAMAENGARVTVAGRSAGKAKALAAQFNCESATLNDLPSLQPEIIMNATSVGMDGSSDIRIVQRKMIRRGMIVFDAVYAPPMTPLLRSAKLAGCRTISGLELFETQAKLQSELFLKSIE